MKFLIDMPLSPELARWLRDRKHEAIHASEVGLATSSDEVIVDFALKNGHTIITADLDYPRLLALMKSSSPGLILFRGGNYSESQTRKLLAKVLDLTPPVDFEHSLVVVDTKRIRRRALPIKL